MKIKIVCVGKIKETYLDDAINEYKKRLSGFADIQLIEVKEVNTNDIKKNICEESNNILSVINDNDFCVGLVIKGKELDSIELANYIKEHYTYNNKELCFIIGGSNGFNDDVIKRCDFKLSFSKMTFPHQLMRVILLEQLYRSMMINNNRSYHK